MSIVTHGDLNMARRYPKNDTDTDISVSVYIGIAKSIGLLLSAIIKKRRKRGKIYQKKLYSS